MNDVKKDMLRQIEAKADKIREYREKAKKHKSVEQFVEDFFKEADSLSVMGQIIDKDLGLESTLLAQALVYGASSQLQEQIIINFDRGALISIDFDKETGITTNVKIRWSDKYRLKNKCEEFTDIGIEYLLFK